MARLCRSRNPGGLAGGTSCPSSGPRHLGEAVNGGKVQKHPEQYSKLYFCSPHQSTCPEERSLEKTGVMVWLEHSRHLVGAPEAVKPLTINRRRLLAKLILVFSGFLTAAGQMRPDRLRNNRINNIVTSLSPKWRICNIKHVSLGSSSHFIRPYEKFCSDFRWKCNKKSCDDNCSNPNLL